MAIVDLQALMSRLIELDVRLEYDDGNLKCHSPVGRLDGDLRQLIAQNKQGLVDLIVKTSPRGEEDGATIKRRGWTRSGEQLSLSFSQRRLWFFEQYASATAAYNIPLAARLVGLIDTDVLERAFNEVVARHESLRTVFAEDAGIPYQVVLPQLQLSLPVRDLSTLDKVQRDIETRRLLRKDAAEPFDLAEGPLIRVGIIRLAEREHVLTMAVHHIVSDGWSLGVLMREMTALYSAFRDGRASPLSEPPIQYADFVRWQDELFRGRALGKQLEYWTRQLADAPILLQLPTDRPRPPQQRYRGATLRFDLSWELTARLNALARQSDATLFMVLLAAFNILLHRYSGQRDLCIGTPVANRKVRELEGAIGFFVNTLVLRTRFGGDEGFDQLLKRVREMALDAYANQDLPFEKLVEELNPQRSTSHSPLFQVLFILQNTPHEEIVSRELSLELIERDDSVSKFDLSCYLSEYDKQLSGRFEYNTDLFDRPTMERLAKHFEALLEGICAEPQQRIASLPLLSEEEKHQLLVEWNATQAPYPKDKTVHELFEAQVQRSPQAVALMFEGEQLSYEELNARANRLAHYLREQGVGPEVLVGLCVERSLEMVVGLLGILKAGGAYVPLDPSYPQERLAYMLEDAKPKVLLTQERLLGAMPVQEGMSVMCLDRDGTLLTDYPQTNPENHTRPENLVYVIYTSGSTGKPKGVEGGHRALVNRLTWMARAYPSVKDGICAQKTSINFVDSVTETLGPLLSGMTLWVIPKEVASDPIALWSEVKRASMHKLVLVPSLLEALLRQDDGAFQNNPLGILITSGEAIGSALLMEARKKLPSTSVLNLYGASEVTGDASYYDCKSPIDTDKSVPIGRPIANTQLHVLDAYGNLVPVGVAGELYVGGDGVGRGYLNRPELTAERFVPDPFSEKQGARLYKTGDLARYLPDGNLEYLGRIDHQVKIRGFRIELGEIEAMLLESPLVAQAVVLAREDAPGDKRLVAYVVPQAGEPLELEVLRAGLKKKLPEYMVPSAFVVLEALPLTPNGKVDRKALPAPDGSRQTSKEYVAPRTALEQTLAGIWAEMLKVEKVGIHDNFFELGGHSLLAVQAVSRLRTELKAEYPLRLLFEHPTVGELAEEIERGDAGQEALLPAIARASREQDLPLSFAQRRLWFLDRYERNSAFYNIPMALRLQGKLDVASLSLAFNELVRRHEALRTVFGEKEGAPHQVIVPRLTVELPLEDLSALDEESRTQEARRLVKEEAAKPFDLEKGPLIRVGLIRLDEHEHILMLTLHHIVSDGWSMGVLFREVATLYGAFVQGEPSPLGELPIQYADYAHWQRQWLQGEVLQEQVNYWKGQLAGAPELLELPTDRPRPALQSYRGALVRFGLSKELSARLNALAREKGVTLFMLLAAGFKALLHRYTGQEDLCVGTAVANRRRSELEGLIGFFVNTLVLRTRVSGEDSFEQLLKRVQETALGAYAHQDLPFEKLVEELNPPRSLSHAPLFQVMLILQNAPRERIESKGLSFSAVDSEASVSKLDMICYMSEGHQGLYGTLEYNTDLFDRPTMERLAKHFEALLEGICAEPQQRIASLPLLSEEEKHQLLVEWNATQAPYPKDKTVHELFEAQVQRSPQAVALMFEGEQLSYEELNARANRLAHYLREQGVGPEVLVGLCVERSLEMVVGLLGILKAGGAYVPLDPSYPQERLAYMLEDAKPKVLLTQERLLGAMPVQEGMSVMCLDRDGTLLTDYPRTNPENHTRPENLVYVIYTSGSTGKPKGVQIEHRSLANLVVGMAHVPGIGASDRMASVAPLAFDLSVPDMFVPLTTGAALVLMRQERTSDASRIAECLTKSGGSVMQATPSTWRMLVQVGWPLPRGKLKIICGGEALPLDLAQELVTQAGGFWNFYGPTEATVWSACSFIDADDTRLTIGRPIANARLYILDAYGNPVPVGVAGELYIGGDGVGRGYLNRPELTAERFVADPFSEKSSARLYRTGDLARYLVDGNLEYLGRIDHQVKIRGFRIELGEIEATLLESPGVAQAVVLAREDVPGDKRLVAYVVPGAGEGLELEALRSALKKRLPEYMVPSAFVVLEGLPLTPNGKIDRKALPEPDGSRQTSKEYVAPTTELEQILAGIWAQVLKVEKVGVHDNFFELGGHSLLAVQAVSRLRAELNAEYPLRLLFEHPTVGELAAQIEQGEVGQEALLPAIALASRENDLPLSFAQQRLWFLDRYERDSAFYNMPMALRLEGTLEVASLSHAFNELVRRHEALRTVFAEKEGTPYQVIVPELSIELALEDLSALEDEARKQEARRLVKEEAAKPFDLAKGPLIRVGLLRLREKEHILMLTLHHIVSDGWSMGVLFREVAALYGAFAQGQVSPLAELPIQYADYAHWQRQWLQGEVLQGQVNYWKEQLAGAPELLELPTDRPRPALQSYRGALVRFGLPKELTGKLNMLAREKGVTLFMLLAAGFKALLHRYTGQEDLCVGTAVANRRRSELEGLIGFFVNTLVLRTRVSGEDSFEQLLKRVQETALGAYAHQDLPFEKLVEELNPPRSLSHAPLFQVMLILQNAPRERIESKALTFNFVASEASVSKFDLTCFLTEGPESLFGTLQYNTSLFDRPTMERLAKHFEVLLEGICQKPQAQLKDLPLLTEQENQQILVQWNAMQALHPKDKTVHELFEEQVQRSPQATALVFDGAQLTYEELNARANRLAHWLQERGVGPEVLVGVYVERSLEMVVALLGILKAGGAYVPLDPTYPVARLAYMLADAAPGVLLTQERLLKELPTQAQVLCLDRDWAQIERYADTNIAPVEIGLSPEHLAYVIYTSGSTGTPKGVMIGHQGAVDYLLFVLTQYGVTAQDRVLQVPSLSFDPSVRDIFSSLLSGATLYVLTVDEARSPREMAKRISDFQITAILSITPSLLEAVISNVDAPITGNLRIILVSGEPLLKQHVMGVKVAFGGTARVVNQYGPTECTMTCTFAHCSTATNITLGRPIANAQIYILDGGLKPVPVGVAGELHIAKGEAGLARGYLNRPELTAEKFIRNPFSEDPKSRLYKTGDRARYLPDGNIEYLGRIDHQVKLRGIRIELGEIESVLQQDAQVSQAVVLMREDSPGDKRLVAYVVPGAEEPLELEALRTGLKKKLPEYMVPSAFVVLEALPLTPNRKVDRKALPAPDGSRQTGKEYVAPGTALEQTLARIWAQVLKVEKVGVHDNFFELGGHSLLAVQLIAHMRFALRRIDKNYDLEIELRDLFVNPTISGIAAEIEKYKRVQQLQSTEHDNALKTETIQF